MKLKPKVYPSIFTVTCSAYDLNGDPWRCSGYYNDYSDFEGPCELVCRVQARTRKDAICKAHARGWVSVVKGRDRGILCPACEEVQP